jgi:hypothetical protein
MVRATGFFVSGSLTKAYILFFKGGQSIVQIYLEFSRRLVLALNGLEIQFA